jgi:SPP1 gp7 family putative phage head morphogenesis protein
MTANQQLADDIVRHAIGLERLSAATVRRVIAALRRSHDRITGRLASGYEPESSRRQQEALLREIRGILDSVYEDEYGRLRIDFDDLAEYEAEFLGRIVGNVAPGLGFSLPSAESLHAAVYSRPFQGRIMRDWFTELPSASFQRLERAIRQGYVEGRTNSQIVSEIRGTRANGYKDGIHGINERAAEVTVRTAVAHVSNAAKSRTYQSNARYLRGVQWVSVLDKRTTLICASRDGKVYPVDKGPRPPAHPRCRSTTTPVLKSQKALPQERLSEVERARLDGQEAIDMTYGDWLRRQSATVQDDVLGKSKGVLFRRGELPIDRFTDKSGAEYTLDELKRREAEAWERAGLD